MHLTAGCIARGTPGCSTCAVALAIVARGFAAAVGILSATISIPGVACAEYRLSKAASQAVRDLDAGRPVLPHTYRLTRVTPVLGY